MQKFAIIDIETTGHTPAKGDRIIEIGLVLVENSKITQEYNQLIHPGKIIPPFITELTNIRQEDVEHQPFFEMIADTLLSYCKDATIVAHNIDFDLPFINAELEQIGREMLTNPVLDTVEFARIFFPQAPSYRLNDLASYLAIQHQHPHRAISDAFVTAELFLVLLEKIKTLPEAIIEEMNRYSHLLKSDVSFLSLIPTSSVERHDLFYYRGLFLKYPKKQGDDHHWKSTSFHTYIEQIYAPLGYLSQTIDAYETRNEQIEMSQTIYDCFQSHEHGLIEAGTGIGKTIAYLVPAIYQANQYDETIVISTSTTHLQSQLVEKDIDKLNAYFDRPIPTAIVKGKSHYLSLEKFEAYFLDREQSKYQDILLKLKILVWLTETVTGDLDEIQFQRKDQQIINQLVVDRGDTLPHWKDYCFYQRMKRQAEKATLVITNHALLGIDLQEGGQLPNYQKLIVDEAHHLESVARKHFGQRISYFEIRAQLQHWEDQFSAASFSTLKKITLDIQYELDMLFRHIFQYVKHQSSKQKSKNDVGRVQMVWNHQEDSHSAHLISEQTKRLDLLCKQMHNVLDHKTDDQLQVIKDQLVNIRHTLKNILLTEQEHSVSWLEIEPYGAKNAAYLYQEPINVQNELSQYLFNRKQSVILTSATLTMKHSFQFIIDILGLPYERLYTRRFGSSFDYQNQVQMLIPNDLPSIKYPDHEEFLYAIAEAIISFAHRMKGRMLVLFTSYDMLRRTYHLLHESEALTDYIVIGQGVSSGSRNRLMKQFQSFQQSILLGTNAYWEGVDLPGKDVNCVIIVKLPFPPPQDPFVIKKADVLKNNGKNPFLNLSLPQAVLRFKQGFGRLIRKRTDRGVILVLDDRLMTKRYGQSFIDSVPNVPILYEPLSTLLEEVESWL
ncbi:bifunctional ATP-dependent DNA helicase/DNA polymerase III subunit epsilon [Gracilibacillus halophilus YIM-C55.5]|uniref:3'-5' exonuclease DinG n=1 Tax=Gracilibacillus halophilus YIM-C55.5 TaxID=1308866 RepID=N4WW50_9BACI|nr:ATP-dependent DNA helicase DinG [Gracilibacillus halophilus]ENH97316.1 bifunctional ATP-dependent DNA helicase/DNA polymerase III subunit epsilon [Gracilibacillus halophilus YIM-C55.5]